MPELERAGNRVGRNQQEFSDLVIWPTVRTRKTLEAVAKVDRSTFAPEDWKDVSYSDYIIPLGDGSSVSQPSLTAEMIEHLDLSLSDSVLEIGTGSGYCAAILSHLARWVDTIEFDQTLAKNAQERLANMGYRNVQVHKGDGAQGLPQHGPYNAIIITAAVKTFPYQLAKQLVEGGRIIAPIGENPNNLQLTAGFKRDSQLVTKQIHSVHFHPLISKFHGGWDSYDEYDKARDIETTEDGIVISRIRMMETVAVNLGIDKDDFLTAIENAMEIDSLKRQQRLAEAQEKSQLALESIDEDWEKIDIEKPDSEEEELSLKLARWLNLDGLLLTGS